MPNNLQSNNGHNKLRAHISKNVAKIATNCLKSSRAATFGQSLGGHNLAIFIRFWRLITPKLLTHWDESNDEKIQAPTHDVQILVFWATFCHLWPHGQHWARGPKSTPRLSVLALPITTNSLLKFDVPEKSVTIRYWASKISVFLCTKLKITKFGKLNLELLDCPWTPGAQYLLPRVYLLGLDMFHIEYKNVARNTKLKSLLKIAKYAQIMKFPDFEHI